MSDFKKTEETGDWELSEDFYNGGTDRDLKLEVFGRRRDGIRWGFPLRFR